jgi:hypothetical protein
MVPHKFWAPRGRAAFDGTVNLRGQKFILLKGVGKHSQLK